MEVEGEGGGTGVLADVFRIFAVCLWIENDPWSVGGTHFCKVEAGKGNQRKWREVRWEYHSWCHRGYYWGKVVGMGSL